MKFSLFYSKIFGIMKEKKMNAKRIDLFENFNFSSEMSRKVYLLFISLVKR